MSCSVVRPAPDDSTYSVRAEELASPTPTTLPVYVTSSAMKFAAWIEAAEVKGKPPMVVAPVLDPLAESCKLLIVKKTRFPTFT